MLAAEQDRIEAERGEARRWTTVAAKDAREAAETLEEALRLPREPPVAYRKADPRVRRLFNQALFERRRGRRRQPHCMGGRDSSACRIAAEPPGALQKHR